MSDVSNDVGRIEHDLDQTRARLGSHLSQLQDRLSPGQILDDLMGYFRGSEGADFGRNLLDSVRANPLPAAITTVGLAWLMASNPRSSNAMGSALPNDDGGAMPVYGHDDHGATMARVEAARAGVIRAADEPEYDYNARLHAAHGQAIGLAQHSDESAESFSDRVTKALASIQRSINAKGHDLRDQAANVASTAGSAARSYGSQAQSGVQDAAASASRLLSASSSSAGRAGGNLAAAITESPILLGALGLAAGALLGALLPHSEQEEAALGGIADKARETVSGLAKEGMERGGRVVQAVKDTAQSAVKDQQLTGDRSPGELVDAALSGDLAKGVKQAASEVLRSGDEAVRKEGFS